MPDAPGRSRRNNLWREPSIVFCICVATVAAAAVYCGRAGTTAPSVVVLHAKGATIRAEVASTIEDLRRGLMDRERLAPDSGMLFVFPRPGVRCLWMKNTAIPLSVAFIDRDGRILNTADMAPNTEDPHCSDGETSYALEVPRGLLARHGIHRGDVVPGITTPQTITHQPARISR